MKHIFLSIAIFLSINAYAQTDNWKFVDVQKNGNIVGHIYHTEAIGRQTGATPEKVPTGIRLVCSSKDYTTQGSDDPLLVLYWNGMYGNTPEKLTIRVDDKQIGVGQLYTWKQDGSVLFRTIAESGEILRAMKNGRVVSFSWTNSTGIQRSTMFDLRTFRQNIDNFNTACKTNI